MSVWALCRPDPRANASSALAFWGTARSVVDNVDNVEINERLFAEFENRINLAVITQTVREGRDDLGIYVPEDLPELLERLVRQRLIDRCAAEESAQKGL